MFENKNDPNNATRSGNQRKIIMNTILAVSGPDFILGKLAPLDIDMAIRQVATGTKYDFVPRRQLPIKNK